MATQNTNITEVVLKQLRKETTTEIILTQDLMNQLVQAMKQWQKKTNQLEKRLKKEYQDVNKIKSIQQIEDSSKDSKIRDMIKNFNENRHYLRGLTSTDDIINHYVQGYELLHRIREIVTGQEIKYRILYTSTSKEERLYELEVDLDTLLKTKNKFNWSIGSTSDDPEKIPEISNLIRLNISNAQAKAMVDKANLAKEKELKPISSAEIQYPILWESLVDYRNNRYGSQKSTYNLGRLYEVYTYLTTKKGFKDVKLEEKTYALVDKSLQHTIGENIKGWQQGDAGLTQLKAVYNANAGLISGSSLRGLFAKLITEFGAGYDMKKLEESLIDIFTAPLDKLSEEADIKNREDAIERIKSQISNLKISVDFF